MDLIRDSKWSDNYDDNNYDDYDNYDDRECNL